MTIDPPDDSFGFMEELRELWAQGQRPMTVAELDAWTQDIIDTRGWCLYGKRRPKRWLH